MNHQRFVAEQENSDSCGLDALRTAFNVCGLPKTTSEELKTQLGQLGFRIRKFGVLSPQIGLLAIKNGLQAELHLNEHKLRRLTRFNTYQRSLDAFTASGGRLKKQKQGPNIGLIGKLLVDGPVIARVTGEEYYGLKGETWGHYLVLVKRGPGFEVLDCFKNMGCDFYDNWSSHLRKAGKFDWYGWQDDLIQLKR